VLVVEIELNGLEDDNAELVHVALFDFEELTVTASGGIPRTS
jgi:hypothetical protein